MSMRGAGDGAGSTNDSTPHRRPPPTCGGAERRSDPRRSGQRAGWPAGEARMRIASSVSHVHGRGAPRSQTPRRADVAAGSRDIGIRLVPSRAKRDFTASDARHLPPQLSPDRREAFSARRLGGPSSVRCAHWRQGRPEVAELGGKANSRHKWRKSSALHHFASPWAAFRIMALCAGTATGEAAPAAPQTPGGALCSHSGPGLGCREGGSGLSRQALGRRAYEVQVHAGKDCAAGDASAAQGSFASCGHWRGTTWRK